MITLLNPPFYQQNTEYFTYSRGRYPNPSLSYITGYLEKRNIKVDIIDAKYDNLYLENIITLIKEYDNKIIGITSNTSEIKSTIKLINDLKSIFPNHFIILGGVHACALPEETLKSTPLLDALAFTEGESILYEMATAKDLRNSLPSIKGIIYREDGRVIKNPPRSLPPTLAGYGPAAYQHWPLTKNIFAITYRGCPYPCSFCFRALGKQVRLRDIEDVMVDLDYIASAPGDIDFNFCDPTFGIERRHTEKILQEIIDNKLNERLKWACSSRVDVLDYDLLKMMREAGCYSVAFGIESGSDRILRETGKNTKISHAMKAVNYAKDLGIKTVGYYIFGHINETKNEIKDTVRAIWKLNTDDIRIGVMVPWPGTKIYKLAKENKGGYRLLSEDYDKYDKYFGEVLEFDNYSLRYLDVMRIIAYFKLYLCNYRFNDLFHFIGNHYKQGMKKLVSLINTKRHFTN